MLAVKSFLFEKKMIFDLRYIGTNDKILANLINTSSLIHVRPKFIKLENGKPHIRYVVDIVHLILDVSLAKTILRDL